MNDIRRTLERLRGCGNFRSIPSDMSEADVYDLSSNDYLGLATDYDLRSEFLETLTPKSFLPASSASRLLQAAQNANASLEGLLAELYGRPALLFNSGYHANTGLISALGGPKTLFLADKLVHASIIDGLKLSGSTFQRFRHNDIAHLTKLIDKYGKDYDRLVIVVESVYSMDGDSPDFDMLDAAKHLHPNALLYVDEAHAVGVCGERGLGLSQGHDVDIMVGTFGKALASMGAFAVMSDELRSFMVNQCRSLIFSTMLPPAVVQWSELTLRRSMLMEERRKRLRYLAARLQAVTDAEVASHIQPLIVGDATRAVELSRKLLADCNIKALPIRTPTVPPGTERLRFSLSATLPEESISLLHNFLNENK